MTFIEIEPLDYEIDMQKQKDLSSISILDFTFPKTAKKVFKKQQKMNHLLVDCFNVCTAR